MICPNCAADNIEGVDICAECGTDLAGLDLPEAASGFAGRLLSAKLVDLSLTEAVVLAPGDTVRAAIEQMREAATGCVLVQENGRLVGLFNERHLLSRVLRKGLDPAKTLLGEVMLRDPIKLAPDDPPAYAIHCMVSRKVRHLPVVSGETILGFISVRNILAFLHEDVLAGATAAS